MRLLIVEDNTALAELLAAALRARGWEADVAASAGVAERQLAEHKYAAMILDLSLPDRDGLSLLNGLRARHESLPVLVLTARSGVEDRVRGLRAGADDYLGKPFATEELVARIEALLRRPGHVLGRVLRTGALVLDVDSHTLMVNGRTEIFSLQELRLLEVLMRRSGRVVPKRQVEHALFGDEPNIMSNAIDVAVHRLRKRLDAVGANVTLHTIRGVGYLLA